MTSRLIPLFFVALLINVFLSLARIPTMGFRPFMVLHISFFCIIAALYFSRRRFRSDISAFILVGILSLFFISGVATLGLLSATFVAAPTVALYLMLLGHRKSAYISIVAIFIYLSIMAALFVSGTLISAASPDLYARSSIAWMLMIIAVVGASLAFVAPLELVPGAIKESEERFRLAFENANVGICVTSLEGRFLKVNDALCEMLGYNRNELEGMSISDITYQDDRDEGLSSIKHVPCDKINLEKRYVHKRGDILWANVSSSLIHDPNHIPEYFITQVRNITGSKHAEERLKQALECQEAIFEGSRDSVFISDRDSRFVAVNMAACELTGYSREELLGMRIPDLHDQPDLHAYKTYSQKIFDGEDILSEAKVLRRDGTKIDVEFNNKRVSIAGKFYMHTTARDITGRRQAEAALIESETKFRSIFENIHDVYFETTLDGKILEISPSIELLSKGEYSRNDVLGKPFINFYQDPGAREQLLTSLGKYGHVSDFEIALKNRDGSIVQCSVSAKLQKQASTDSDLISGTIRDITERKQAEMGLQASELQFRELWESTVEGIAIHKRGTILEVNKAMCRMFDITREQAVGKSLLEFAPAELKHLLLKHIDSGEEGRFETSALRPNGGKLILEVFSKHIVYHGEIVTMAAVDDITERKQSEDALRESEERYQRITKAITDYIYTVRVEDGRATETSHGLGCVTVTGYQSDEFKKNPFLWFDMVIPDDRSRVEEQARLVLAGEDPPPLEHRIIHKDGSVRWVRNTFVLHRNEDGEIIAYDGLVQDITERKQAEEALQESELKYRQLVEGFPDAIAIYADGKIVFANSASVRLLRAPNMGELIGKPILDLVHPKYREMITARMEEALSSSKPLPLLEEKFLRLDGSEVDVEVTSLPLTFGKKPAVQIVIRDITEKKIAQQALQESQQRYRATVEQSNEGITIADPDGRYIMVNPAYCTMTGYTEEELLKMTIADLMPKQSSLKLFLQVAKEHTAGYREIELMRKNGSRFIALITGSSLEIGNGRYVQGIVQDITERKRAEEVLRENEERFHSMFEMHDSVMLLIEPVSGKINDANPAAEKFYGYSVDQLRGMFIQDINMMSSGETATERLRAGMSEKSFFVFSHRLANGKLRTVEVHSSPIKLGGTQSLFSIIHDITERKEAEEQLRKLSLAIEQSPASIVITDTQGNIEYVNPKFTQVSGYTLEEARGKKPSILKSGETSPEEYKKLWEAITNGNDWRGEFHNKKKNGELFWEIASISPVKDTNSVITNFVAVKEDITERKRAEEALRHAQKLESIGTLAGGIAHDFNNLLNAIMGQSSLALGRLPKESPAGSNIAKALKAAERAADLTRQLLAYSGKGKFLNDDFDLNRLVEENAQLLEVSVPKSTHLRYELDSATLCMRGDVGQVQQVVMNLIINAGEALGANPGTITVRTRQVEVTKHDTEFWKYTNNPLSPGMYVSFQVNDTGDGIKPEALARIFDPFFTTKFTGRGLGLAAVLGIIRGHRGGIRIQSERGKGTEFEVVFPMVDASAKAKMQEMKGLPIINGEGKTILVIDDEPSVLELLTDVFTDAKYKVIEALNPIDGIELYREHQHSILMVILDYSMPGMDGKAAFQELLKINHDVKVILCSGYTEEEIKSVFGDTVPQAFIQKPYKPSSLLEKASAMLAQENAGV